MIGSDRTTDRPVVRAAASARPRAIDALGRFGPWYEDEPFIHLRANGAGVVVTGAREQGLGHRVPRPDGDDDGVFGGWTWDGAGLRVGNDRYGFQPLYYFAGPGEIAVSTSIARLLAAGAPAELDHTALALFLRLGCFVGEDTAFQAIRAVPPAARVQWRDGRLRIEGGFRISPPQRLGRAAAIDAYIELFRTAMRRRSPGDDAFTVPLSGGRDSRHILLELCEMGHRPAFTITARYFAPGDTSHGEVEIAEKLATALGVPHVVVGPPSSRLPAELRNNVEANFSTTDIPWTLAVADYVRGRVSAVYDGIGGDVLSAGLLLTAERLELFRSGRLEALARHLLDADAYYDRRPFAGEVSRRLGTDVAVERLVRELGRHVEAANPVGSFFFWNRTRRKIAMSPYRLLARAGADVFAPYLDHDVFDLLSGLPAEFFLDHAFHTEAIHRAYPRHADIPFSVKSKGERTAAARRAGRRFALDVAAALIDRKSVV